jgi:hypothetical protein
MLRGGSYVSLDCALGNMEAVMPIDAEMQEQLSRLSLRTLDSPPLIKERRESFHSPPAGTPSRESGIRSRSTSIAPALRELEQIRLSTSPDAKRSPPMRSRARSMCNWGACRAAPRAAGDESDDANSTPAFADLQPLKFLGSGAFANVFMCRDKVWGGMRVREPTQHLSFPPGRLQPLKFLGSGAFANVFMCREKVWGA